MNPTQLYNFTRATKPIHKTYSLISEASLYFLFVAPPFF